MARFLKSSPSRPSRPNYFSFPFLIFFPRAGRPAQLAQRTSACPACLLSSPRPTLILTHSGPAAFPAHPRVAHLAAQWPAPAHPDLFVLTTPAEAEPSARAHARATACRAPLPPESHRPRLCPHAPVLAVDSIVLCAPHRHLIPSKETLN
jgi:hypothetical protein